MVKYIFCISTGRSGSTTLTKIFESIPGCYSVHEPQPIMNGLPQKKYLNGKKNDIRKLMAEKLMAIAKNDCEVYFESNHSFIKAFGWELVKAIPIEDIGIIVLNRDEVEIAKSLQRIHCSPFNVLGRDWIILPSWRRRNGLSVFDLLKYVFLKSIYNGLWCWNKTFHSSESILESPDFIKKAELKYLLWYVSETTRITKEFFWRYPNIKRIEINTHELNMVDKVSGLITFFGLQVPKNLETVVGIKYNQKRNSGE